MKIGILTAGHTPPELHDLGNYTVLYSHLLRGQGFSFENYDVVDGVFPEDVHAADGWLISGSRHGAYEEHAFIPRLEEFIRDAHSSNIPVVGICFGHQIVAQAMGGKVEKFEGGWAVGRNTYDFNGQQLALNAWHQDQVTVLPVGAEVVASSPFCANAAMVYGNRAFTVQPHPEFESDFVDGLIRERGKGVVPDAILAEAAAQLAAPNDNATLAALIGRFFRERSIS